MHEQSVMAMGRRVALTLTSSLALLMAGLGLSAPASANGNCVTYWEAGSGTWSGAPAAGGTGTAADPYRVGSDSDLDELQFCPAAHFRQIADIALTDPWAPIAGDFTGSYDGGGFGISNLSAPLFSGIRGGGVTNLVVAGEITSGPQYSALLAPTVDSGSVISHVAGSGSVNGTSMVGGLVGSVVGSSLDNLIFDGTVTGTSYRVGGIAGETSDTNLTGGLVTGTVTGVNDTGGVIGNVCGGTINQVSSMTTVTGAQYTGGVLGSLDSCAGEIANAYSGGSVTGTSEVGGVMGTGNTGVARNLYSEGTVTGTGDKVGGLAGSLSGVPLTQSSTSADVTGTNFVGGAVGSNDQGVDSITAVGTVSGADHVGGLIGYQAWQVVANSMATGSVSSNGGSMVGGLIGDAWNSTLRNTVAYGNVTAAGASRVGGLVGAMTANSVISSYAAGTVTGHSSAGGLVGEAEDASIKRSAAIGAVAAEQLAGGLVGAARTNSKDSLITDSYSQGAVTATGTSAGGLVGWADLRVPMSIASSYATGVISSDAGAGGLVGDVVSGTIRQPVESFWNGTANPTLPDGTGSKKTEAQLQEFSTFQDAGWDIAPGGDDLGNTWGICVPSEPEVNGGFPFLIWETYETPCAHAVSPASPVLNTLTPADGALQVVASLGTDGGAPITAVEYSLDGGEWISSGGTSGTFTISGLTNGTSYRVAVRAVNEIGPSDPSNEVSATPVAPPTPTPTVKEPSKAKHLKVDAGRKAARATWDQPSKDGGSAITGYKVWLSKPGQRSFSYYRTTSGESMRFAKLRAGTKYWVKVKAFNSQTNGCASVVKFRTDG